VRGIRKTDRVLIVGMTGKGKTTLGEYIAAGMQPMRLIVFDPKAELDFGIPIARSPAELAIAMHQPVVHYVPSGFERDELEEACQIVWETPGPYIWWVDETSEVSSPSWVPRGLRNGVTQGRKDKKLILALVQRIAESHPVFRSQAEHVFIFVPTPVALDLKMIAGSIRREPDVLEAELVSLHEEFGDFAHLWYVRETDELRRCAPIPLGRGMPRPDPSGARAA
jgi:energy-coupling factor transporter ATP-binding protein EcfA2